MLNYVGSERDSSEHRIKGKYLHAESISDLQLITLQSSINVDCHMLLKPGNEEYQIISHNSTRDRDRAKTEKTTTTTEKKTLHNS